LAYRRWITSAVLRVRIRRGPGSYRLESSWSQISWRSAERPIAQGSLMRGHARAPGVRRGLAPEARKSTVHTGSNPVPAAAIDQRILNRRARFGDCERLRGACPRGTMFGSRFVVPFVPPPRGPVPVERRLAARPSWLHGDKPPWRPGSHQPAFWLPVTLPRRDKLRGGHLPAKGNKQNDLRLKAKWLGNRNVLRCNGLELAHNNSSRTGWKGLEYNSPEQRPCRPTSSCNGCPYGTASTPLRH
jgi:hypothetical protein